MHVLVIDDEPDIRELLGMTLQRMGVTVRSAADLAGARKLLGSERFQLCLSDVRLPDGSGMELLAFARQHCPQTPVAMITAYGSVEAAVEALKAGAFDFLSKPVDTEQLRRLVEAASGLETTTPTGSPTLVGDSPVIRKLLTDVERLARVQAPVFLHGESGVGKELVARSIHRSGPRHGQPFVPVNCGAIPQELVESELFGHVKGSFTGANSDREGLFQAADGGTLFLDEIGDLPISMQVRLLRAIQERSVRPVGARREQPVDVRILSATNESLQQLVEQKRFRRDLYYRINVIELYVPPLRERREDIPLLTEHFLRRIAAHNGHAVPRLDAQALTKLQDYDYPGNVRELENLLERALALCHGDVVTEADLQLPQHSPVVQTSGDRAELDSYLEDVERRRILDTLEQTRWNRTRAAKLLGITLRALRYRMERLGLREAKKRHTDA